MHELQHKRPATVVDTRPVVTMRAPYHARAALLAEVKKLSSRGDIRPMTAQPSYNSDNGQWELRVIRLHPPAPGWTRIVMAGAAAVVILSALAGLAVWVVSSLAAAPLALFLIALLIAFAVLLRAGRRAVVQVETTTKVTVRR